MLWTTTHVCGSGDLGEIDPIRQVSVGHTVLASSQGFRILCMWQDQVPPLVVQVFLEIDADPKVVVGLWTVDVQVGKADFDDLGKYLARFLVGGDAHFWSGVVRVEPTPNGQGEAQEACLRELVKCVAFASVNVGYGNAGIGGRHHRMKLGVRGPQCLVNKLVHDDRLGLLKALENVESNLLGRAYIAHRALEVHV